jgi:8-oxo-dGTP pyrophosphatase MutT (NUDIX family)
VSRESLYSVGCVDHVPGHIPAATLIVMRERRPGPPQLLMVERASTMVFGGGATVFPGGRIDPGDWEIAGERRLLTADPPEDAPARIAAVRETLEEAAVAIGFDPLPDQQEVALLAAALRSGAGFASLLAQRGWRLDLERLIPWSRMRPPAEREVARRFDARFYLGRAPDSAEPEADGTENVRLLWISAADALAAADRGECRLMRPTRHNLSRLAAFSSVDDLCAHASASVPESWTG